MAKRNDLKQKLKAADRRRQRRMPQSGNSPAVGPNATSRSAGPEMTGLPDVTGLIARALVKLGMTHRDLVDSAAIAGLRGGLSSRRPTGSVSNAVFDEIQKISQRDDVTVRAVRGAIKDLLETASKHQSKGDDPKSFLNYLALLTS
ncbi:MAG: hypothetical protein HKN47_17660 [Pirellulaceae bacterium]|nr:hypothetical protein [Pirellulaceae bacterium]